MLAPFCRIPSCPHLPTTRSRIPPCEPLLADPEIFPKLLSAQSGFFSIDDFCIQLSPWLQCDQLKSKLFWTSAVLWKRRSLLSPTSGELLQRPVQNGRLLVRVGRLFAETLLANLPPAFRHIRSLITKHSETVWCNATRVSLKVNVLLPTSHCISLTCLNMFEHVYTCWTCLHMFTCLHLFPSALWDDFVSFTNPHLPVHQETTADPNSSWCHQHNSYELLME